MPPETEVISCPACHHLLRVPHEWLGQTVQCPECRALFKGPSRAGDSLTPAELISRPQATPVASPRKRLDVMLLFPAFGLMLCGVAGMAINGVNSSKLLFDPDGGRAWVRSQVEYLHSSGFGATEPGENLKERNDRDVEQVLTLERWMLPACFLLSLGEFLGGLSIALHWNYRLAQIGCVLAMLNIANFCCLPGIIVGIWGLLMISSEEGGEHFQ